MRDEQDNLLETLGFDVADGTDLDWPAVERSARRDRDQRLIEDLKSLSLMARFYRELRQQAEASGLLPGSRWRHLEILELTGQGSYADVYRARDTRLNREVALKLLRPGIASDTEALEGERLANVKHPNLVTVYGAASEDGALGLWMEYVRGETLRDRVEAQGPLGPREAAALGIELCGALAALHAAGLVHRDVKAQNVMREQGGRTVLMDLGAGTEIGEGPERHSGTPLYMAPEVLNGGAGTPRSDIYSLGILLYYAVCGRHPVTADTVEELRDSHRRDERRRLRDVRPDLPTAFIRVIERAIAPDPEARFETVGEMEQALATAAETDRAAVPETTRRPRARIWAGLLAVALAAWAILFLWPRGVPSAGYTIDATLLRAAAGTEEALLPGSRVVPGDRIHLELEASRDLHVYVLAEDDRGEAYLLFPLPGCAVRNPLAGERRHRLPPDQNGRRFSWGVSSAGGTEHLLIVASPEALVDFEAELATLPPPQRTEALAMPLDPEALASLRGVGLLVESDETIDAATRRSVFAKARRLGAGPEAGRGVWVRQIDLINPDP